MVQLLLQSVHTEGAPADLWRVTGEIYFFAGAGAGTGCVFAGCVLIPCRTDVGPPRLLAYTASVMEVIMNITADQVVALDRALVAPRGPKAVWLP